MTSLKLYTVNKDFYDYLAKYDNKLMAISEGKDRRPMVGIVLEVGDFKYLEEKVGQYSIQEYAKSLGLKVDKRM